MKAGARGFSTFCEKGTKAEHNYKAAEICHKYGVKIWANYMFGIPTETKEEVMDTVKMIKKIRPDHYSAAFYTPHPGSDLYDYCIENDLSLIKSHDSYRRNPTEAKIKGVDYEFLHWAMQESMTGQKRFRSLVKHRLKTLRHFSYYSLLWSKDEHSGYNKYKKKHLLYKKLWL